MVPDAAILPVVARKNSGVSIYAVASALEKKGWNMFTGQHPPVMSVCFGEQHLKSIDQWCVDLNESVAHVKAHPNEKLEGQCAVYGAAQVNYTANHTQHNRHNKKHGTNRRAHVVDNVVSLQDTRSRNVFIVGWNDVVDILCTFKQHMYCCGSISCLQLELQP